MYLADDIFQATSGVGVNTHVIFCSALAQLYPVKAYNATVERVVARRGIETRLQHNLIEVRPEEQAPVLVANLLAQLDGRPLLAHYDGYTACPLITSFHSVVMAEFDYDLQPVSSFLVDPTKERWSMFLVETRVFPWVYWHRVLKGRLHESRFLKPFKPLVRALGLARKEP